MTWAPMSVGSALATSWSLRGRALHGAAAMNGSHLYAAPLTDDGIRAGDGLRCRIVGIRDESEGRKTRAIWV